MHQYPFATRKILFSLLGWKSVTTEGEKIF